MSNTFLTLTINLYKKEYTGDIRLMLLDSVCKVLSTQDINHILFDLKGWNIPKDLALDRSTWKTAIHVPEP